MLLIDKMEVPTTLEELLDPKRTALLLIDLQNDYVMPGGYMDKAGEDISPLRGIILPTKRILEAAREIGILVIHVQMTYYPNFLVQSPATLRPWLLRMGYSSGDAIETLPWRCLDGTWGWQIVDELRPEPNETLIKKNRSSAFMGTNLDLILRSNGIQSLVFAGLVTHGCVLGTAHDAHYLDYYPILLRDCIGSTRSALHEAALLIMERSMDVADSGDVLRIWSSQHHVT